MHEIPPDVREKAFGIFRLASHWLRLSPDGVGVVIIFLASQLPYVRQFSIKKKKKDQDLGMGAWEGHQNHLPHCSCVVPSPVRGEVVGR